MELLHLTSEYTVRVTVEKDGEPVYDVGVIVDQHVLNVAREDAITSVFRLVSRRFLSDWKDKRF